MLLVRELLGHVGEPRFAGRSVDRLRVDSASAARRRLRSSTEHGLDVAIDLERGSYLEDGAVLADDGSRIVVVERPPEPALVIRFASDLDRARLVEQAALVAHAFGNQHVPVEAESGELRVPITTSPEVAEATVRSLGLPGIELEVTSVPLGRGRPLAHGHAH